MLHSCHKTLTKTNNAEHAEVAKQLRDTVRFVLDVYGLVVIERRGDHSQTSGQDVRLKDYRARSSFYRWSLSMGS